MSKSLVLQAAVLLFGTGAVAQISNEQGPAALFWPPDRRWGAVADNTAPCGSEAPVGNRTNFPLTGGQLSMTVQDGSYNITVALSYISDPIRNADFDEVVADEITPDLNPGHACFAVPDAREGTEPGTVGTYQIRYTSQFDNPENETFYACADVTFVEQGQFDEQAARRLCFNASVPEEAATSAFTNNPAHSEPTAAPGNSNPDSSSGGNSLSGGAIAGIVVGVLAGVAILGALAFFAFKRYHRGVKANAAHTYRMDNLQGKKTVDSASDRT